MMTLAVPRMSPLLLPYQGVQQLAILAHKRGLHGSGAGVDANKHTTLVAIEVTLGHNLLVVTALELVILRRRGKERLQARDLGTCVSPKASIASISCGNVESLLDS